MRVSYVFLSGERLRNLAYRNAVWVSLLERKVAAAVLQRKSASFRDRGGAEARVCKGPGQPDAPRDGNS